MTPSHSWRLEVFGTPRLTRPDGSSLHPEGGALALLTYLALEGPTTRSRLAGLLWPDTVESAARNNLVHLLRRIGRVYGEGLLRPGDVLDLAPEVETDARAFLESARVGDGKTGDYGPLLEGVEFDDRPDLADWLLAWRERLGNLHMQLLTRRAGQQEDQGDLGAAITTTLWLLDLNPVAEEGWRRLMRLHYLGGDRGAALAAFERCKEVLRREFGAEPSPETWQVAREVERGEALAKPAAHQPRIPLSVLRPPALIGREDIWGRMEAAWEAGQLIYLTGAPGTGKTRLALDFARSKGTALRLDHHPGDETVPYASSARWMREMLRHAPDIALTPFQKRELSRLLPELREGDVPPLGGEEGKLAFYEVLAQVADLALAGVTAVVSDDIQHDDDASQDSGRYYAARAATGGSGSPQPRVLLTFRQGELSPQTHAVMRGLVDAGLAVLIELQPLGVPDVRVLLSDLDLPFAPGLDEALYRYAGGNPLFVLETVKFLVEEGLLERGLPERLAPPGRTGSVLERRLARLSPAALQAARAAGVLRSDFSLELVAEVLGAPLLGTAAAWEELEAAQIMSGERFSHDLLYEAVLGGMPETVRRLLHRSAARVLVRHGAHPQRVAQHWWEGTQPQEAAVWFERAGQAAEAALRPHEAEVCYQHAVEAYEAAGDLDAARRIASRSSQAHSVN